MKDLLIDKNGKTLKRGDWILYHPNVYAEDTYLRVGKISSIRRAGLNTPDALIHYQNDPEPRHRNGSELEKISEVEAMIYILENS